MEFLTSFINQIANRGIINQARLKSIHIALLDCLENTAEQVGREDYHPGEINLSQWSYSHSIVLRLIVGRNGVNIFSGDLPFPELTIFRQYSGEYLLLDGIAYKNGREIHRNIGNLPHILTSLSSIHFHETGSQNNVVIDRIS